MLYRSKDIWKAAHRCELAREFSDVLLWWTICHIPSTDTQTDVRLSKRLLRLWTYMYAHMCLQISGFDKWAIAKKERTTDWSPLFFSRTHNLVITKIETKSKMLYWVVIVLNLDDLSVLVTSFIVLLNLFLGSNAENHVGLTKAKIL